MDKITNVYLDFASTTPISGEVYREMLSAINDNFGNAESLYAQGRQAKQTLEDARAKIAKAIGASASEIYFTSGSTEGNNWALKGIARANRSKGNHMASLVKITAKGSFPMRFSPHKIACPKPFISIWRV